MPSVSWKKNPEKNLAAWRLPFRLTLATPQQCVSTNSGNRWKHLKPTSTQTTWQFFKEH